MFTELLLWVFVYTPLLLGIWHIIKLEIRSPGYPFWFHVLSIKSKDWDKLGRLLRLNWHCFWMEIKHPYWLYYTKKFLWWVGYKFCDWISKG